MNMQKIGQLQIQLIGGTVVLFTRFFKASARQVFDAHTKPELVRRWLLGPPGSAMTVCEIDLRVGGRWRFGWAHPQHGSFAMGGEFFEIDAPRRLRNSEGNEEMTSMQVITFAEQDGGTLMSQTNTFPSAHAREAALSAGMADGMEPCYAALDGMFAEAK
jgi:uncharacterized protein YndB with AHSA1/START domain